MRLIEQFCQAYEVWDQRSQVGVVYLTTIMQYLGGHGRRGYDAYELGEYTVDDLREELLYLTGEQHMDAAFLVASVVRAVDAELVAATDASSVQMETMPQQRDFVEQMVEQHGGTLPDQALQSIKSMLESVREIQDRLADAPRAAQQRLAHWRELLGPMVDRQNLDTAHAEQWGDSE